MHVVNNVRVVGDHNHEQFVNDVDQSAITEAVRLGNQDMVVALITLFSSTSSQPYQVSSGF